MKRTIVGAVWAFALAAVAQAATLSIETIPVSGNVSGVPGSVVGWGFTLTDTETDEWIVLNDSYFTGSTVYGTYVDYVASNFYVAGPSPESQTLNEPWNPSTSPPTGLGEFDINATAPPGFITGDINVDYQLFSQDPNDPDFDPDTAFISSGTFSAPVQADVVPEPATMAVTGATLLALAFAIRRRRRGVVRPPSQP